MTGGQSKLDKKIARDKLLRNLEPFWDELCECAEGACGKLNKEYGETLAYNRNDQNSVIRVSRSRMLVREASSIEETLEIRIDRNQKKIVARIDTKHSRGQNTEQGTARVYQLAGNPDITGLEATSSSGRFNATELAEHEIAEQLVKLKLEP